LAFSLRAGGTSSSNNRRLFSPSGERHTSVDLIVSWDEQTSAADAKPQ
jgi:hypothetical protein